MGAHRPDVSACIAVAAAREQALEMFHEALQLHFEEMLADGDSLPELASEAATASISVAQLPVAV